ncbi:hypothetical protein BGW37DRAFT_543380 [Umbelopsis sp. PMI_123]|nr:hypothetical protein BGW37DRAFT_543380 [Umbelopsis sp. PMI_123]
MERRCCFQQKSIPVSPDTWNISVVASDSRYNLHATTYYTTLSFPSAFSLISDPTAGQSFNCQPAKASTNVSGINTITCISDNNENFMANFVLTATTTSNGTSPNFTTLSVDEDNCTALQSCNREDTISSSDVIIGSQVYPKWSIALIAVAVAIALLALAIVIIRFCVNRSKTVCRIMETNTEYSDYSRRPTENSYMSQNEKPASRNGTMTSDQYATDTELGHDIDRYRQESNKDAYDRLSDIENCGSEDYTTGKLPSMSSFRRLHFVSSRTLLTSLPTLPSLPKLPSFNSMPFPLTNSYSSQNSITEAEPFRPTNESSLSEGISESTISVIGKTNTVNSRAAVEAHKVIRRASRKSKTRSTIFTEEHINKIFHLEEDEKHKSLTELYPQYGDIRSKSTATLGTTATAAITTNYPNSVRVKHRESTILAGMQAELIERSMSASNVMGAQSDDNELPDDDEIPFITIDEDELRPKTRNRSTSLTQQFRHACDDFGISRNKRSSGYSNRSLDSRGRKRQSVCSIDAKRRSQSATPSAASTIRPRSFLLQRSVYDDDSSSSSDDNSDTITRAKFQRRYRSLTHAGSQKSGSPKRRSPPSSSMSNASDVDTIRKHLQASWKTEITESPSHDSLSVDADVNLAPIKQRRPALPEGFMRHRTDRFSRPASMIDPVPEPEPPNDLTSQDSLATLSSFVPEHGYTSEDTDAMSYSNAVSLAILQTDSISSGLTVLSIHKGKHETESCVCGLNEINSESNRSFHSQQSLSDLAIGDPRPSDVSFF